MSTVLRSSPAEGVARLEIHRPQALNALMPEVLIDLDAHLSAIESDASVRAVIVAGAGGKAFVAGADIASMASMDAWAAEAFSALGQRVLDRLSGLSVPVIAAVGGFALGGGCELAMAADIVLAGPNAKFGQPEVKLGVIPGFGGTQRLIRRVGPAAALDLCLTGRMIDAQEALRLGIASRVVEGDVEEAALALAVELAQLAPRALTAAKRALHEAANLDLAAAQRAERSLFALCFATADQKEGMAAFLAKRPATFTGR